LQVFNGLPARISAACLKSTK